MYENATQADLFAHITFSRSGQGLVGDVAVQRLTLGANVKFVRIGYSTSRMC